MCLAVALSLLMVALTADATAQTSEPQTSEPQTSEPQTSEPQAVQSQTSGPQPVLYSPPVLTAVEDPFRPPAHIGAPGNRGLEYGNTDGEVVAAAADGWVIFAGQVAGRRVITIEHDDGVRTTYTGLLDIWVVQDQAVSQYSGIAIAGGNLHFGARMGEHYLDPQILIDASEERQVVRLVPPEGERG